MKSPDIVKNDQIKPRSLYFVPILLYVGQHGRRPGRDTGGEGVMGSVILINNNHNNNENQLGYP